MYQIYEQSIDNQNIQTLSQIMLNFPFILQLKESFSSNDFYQLIQAIQYQRIIRKQPFALEVGCLYLFLGGGSIYRREATGKTQKSIKKKQKQKTWTSTVSKGFNRIKEVKDSPRVTIQQFDSYEEPQTLSKYLQDFYHPSSHNQTTVLYINLLFLKPHLYNRIRQNCHQKVKFLANSEQMNELDWTTIADRQHKFKYLQLHFGKILYSRGIRPNLVFLLKNGLVEVRASKTKRSGYVVNPKSMLGLRKAQEQWGRCVSQKVECYCIKIEDLVTYFPSLAQSVTFYGKRQNTADAFTSPSMNNSQISLNKPSSSPAANILMDQKNQSNCKEALTKRRHLHKSMQNIKGYDRKKSKMLALRQHFSNYYNEMFDQFSELKIKQMKFGVENQENLNLYKIKVLERKSPAMEELKNRLKKIRIQKINACKERLKRKVYIQSCQGSGVTIIEEQI